LQIWAKGLHFRISFDTCCVTKVTAFDLVFYAQSPGWEDKKLRRKSGGNQARPGKSNREFAAIYVADCLLFYTVENNDIGE
jgi:hypothetical protein